MPRRPTKTPPLPEHVVSTPEDLADCLKHLSEVSAVAFDTEFVGEDAYRPELCLVQVAGLLGDGALIEIDAVAFVTE